MLTARHAATKLSVENMRSDYCVCWVICVGERQCVLGDQLSDHRSFRIRVFVCKKSHGSVHARTRRRRPKSPRVARPRERARDVFVYR